MDEINQKIWMNWTEWIYFNELHWIKRNESNEKYRMKWIGLIKYWIELNKINLIEWSELNQLN